MNDPETAKEHTPESERPKPAAALPPQPEGTDRAKSNSLTAEEQMALYEEDLKENDWGHQPC